MELQWCHRALNPRGLISAQASRLDVCQKWGRGTVWRVAYISSSILAAWVADMEVCVDGCYGVDNDQDDYIAVTLNHIRTYIHTLTHRYPNCPIIPLHSLPQTLPHPLRILDLCTSNLDPQAGRSCWRVLQFRLVHPLYRRYCALTRAYPCTLTTVLILAVCCTVSHSARFSLTCTLRQWRRQMTSSTMHRNRRTVLSVKMERSWNGEGTYCVTEDLGLDSRQRLDMFYSLRPDGRWG